MRTCKLIILILLSSYWAKSQELAELSELKVSTDSIRTANKNSQLIFVRTADNEVVKVTNGKWPKEIVTTYNILIHNDRTLMIGVYPYSESGDWSRQHTYYFDSSGRTFAYEHKLNSFNSICTEILKRNTLIFFDRNSKELIKTYSQTDKDGVEVMSENCVFNYPYEHQPYATLSELMQEEGINGW